MAIAFKKGDVVRQLVPVIQGAVVDVAIVDGDVQFCVEYTCADGDVHQRFFTEAEIEKAAEV